MRRNLHLLLRLIHLCQPGFRPRQHIRLCFYKEGICQRVGFRRFIICKPFPVMLFQQGQHVRRIRILQGKCAALPAFRYQRRGIHHGEFCQHGRFLTDDDRLKKIPRMLPAGSRCRKQQTTTGDQPGG